MNDEISNPYYIMDIINKIKEKFENETFKKYNNFELDAMSFFQSKHSATFASIINEVLNDLGTFYYCFSEETGHVITKFGDHYYDASGLVDYLIEYNIGEFEECPKDYFPVIKDMFTTDMFDKEIESDLIEYGKQIVQLNKNKAKTKSL